MYPNKHVFGQRKETGAADETGQREEMAKKDPQLARSFTAWTFKLWGDRAEHAI